MIGRCYTLALLMALILAAPASGQAADLLLKGSTTVTGALAGKEPAVEAESGVEIDVEGIGSSRGIAALLKGEADIGMISAPLGQVVAKMNEKNPGSVDSSILQAHQVGETIVSFIVHPSNPVKRLTLAQIAEILSGRATNWQDFGGEDTQIDVTVAYKGDGIRTMVEKALLDSQSVAGKPRQLRYATLIPKVIEAVPSALGVVTVNQVGKGVMPLQTDLQVTQPLYFVTKGAPTPEMQRLIDAARNTLGG